ncbi:MAG: serine/threonine protein kinase, partial [Candidatus Eisenbacteria bacterium]|nr:serine/threonine protein kinase [Candidatus Eisenbacteria bacterium]
MENPDGNPLPSDMRDLQNTLLGRYQIQKLLGRGGMGEVYLAQDTMLKRAVALKRLRPDREHSQEESQRILREAQAASKLSNPRIAAVYDVLKHQGEVFLVMEYVDGTSLRDLLLDSPGNPLPLDRFFDIANQCVQAFDAAHTAGLVHQDIKPDNIMVMDSGQIKILDFGLAVKVSSEDDLRTLSTETFHERESGGTPSYMAPEAILGRTLDRRADIYSLGVTFYELLARERPFTKDSDVSLVDQVLHHDPIPLTKIREDIPEGLASVVQRMMAKDPEARYASARDMLKDLVAAEQGENLSTGAQRSMVQKESFWKSRTGAVVFALAGLILFTLWSR